MGQLQYKKKADVAREGMAYDTTGFFVSAINKNPQAKQIDTITIDTATDTEEYGVDIDGISSVFTAEDTVKANIAIGMAAVINAEPLVNGRVVAVRAGDTLVLTARIGGVPFVTETDENAAKMTLVATQANAIAAEVEFGRLVVMDGQNDGSGAEILGRLAQASTMTAREVTLVPTPTNSEEYLVSVKVEGKEFTAFLTGDGSDTAAEVVDAMVASLNDQLPAQSVLAANVADELVLTSELAGKNFEYGTGYGLAASAWTVAADNEFSADVDINTLALGIAEIDHSVEKPRPTVPGQIGGSTFNAKYAPNKSMAVKEDGRTYVVPEGTPVARRSPVFVRLVADGALDKVGGFAAAAGTGLALLTGARWHKVDGSFSVVQMTLR